MDRLGVQLYFFIEIDHSKVSSTHQIRLQTTELFRLFTSVFKDCRSLFSSFRLPSHSSWYCLCFPRLLFMRTLKSLCVAHVALAFGGNSNKLYSIWFEAIVKVHTPHSPIIWTPTLDGMWLDADLRPDTRRHLSRRDWFTCSKHTDHSRVTLI